MNQSRKRVIPKKRGRPATGNDPVRSFRMPDELMGRIDNWSAEQGDGPSRAEAIRRLVEIGLKAKR
jgi:predicted DNA-binding protein